MSSSLPPGWIAVPLSSLVSGKGEMCDGDWVESKDQDPNGDVRLIQLADVGMGTFVDKSDRYLTSEKAQELNCTFLEAGDLLISRLGEPLGKTCLFPVLDPPCVTVVDVHIFRSGHSDISHGWLVHFLNSPSIRREVDAQSSGTTRKRITGQRLKDLVIPVPPSQEQCRIASKIDELFSDIGEGERALARVQKLVERYRQSVLKAAVTGELTREWREQRKGKLESGADLLARILKARRAAWEQAELAKMKAKGIQPADDEWKQKYKEPVPPNIADLPELPEGWVWVSLPLLCSESPVGGISVKGSNRPPGVPALRLDAIGLSGFDYSAKRYIPITQDQTHRLSIRGGDFFVSRANGSISLVGRGVLAQEPPEQIVFPDTMIRYRMTADPNVRGWIATAWQSQLIRTQVERKAKTTAGIYKISQQDIAEIAIPFPPLLEQKVTTSLVAERLSQVIQLRSDANLIGREVSVLRQSVLKAAFAGALVSQGGSDEPATVLLERIAAERALSAIAAKPSRKAKPRKG